MCRVETRDLAHQPSPTPRSFASADTIAAPEGIQREAMLLRRTALMLTGSNERDDGGADE